MLADEVQDGRLPLRTFADQLRGHAEALEGISYHRVKEAQLVQGQVLQAIEMGREVDVDREALVGWLRTWIANIPVAAVA